MISKEMYRDWLGHPVTVELMSEAKTDQEQLLEAYQDSAWVHDPIENAKAVGQLKYINWLVNEFNPVDGEDE